MKYIGFFAVAAAFLLAAACLYAQSPVWFHSYNSANDLCDYGYGIVQGDDGNIYVAGLRDSLATGSDFFVMSLSTIGSTNWTFSVSGTDLQESAYDIVYGLDGNIYAAGGMSGGIMVLCLSATGDSNWTYRLPGSAGQGRAEAIVYGEDGNIYVTGGINDTLSAYDFTVVSLSDAGAERWVYQYQGAGNWYDHGYDLVYGLDGNIYATGYSQEVMADPRWFVASLDTAGNERWTWDSYMPGSQCRSIWYGTDDNLYLCGQTNNNFAVVSLDTAGSYRWEYVLTDGNGYGTSIIQGADGRFYAAGSGPHTEGHTIIVVCLDPAGSEEWVFKYDTTFVRSELADVIVSGPDGNLYVGGGVGDTISSAEDFIVLSIDTLGTERWAWRYDRDGDQDWCEDMCVGVDGNIYATGGVSDSVTVCDLVTVCFDVLPPSAPQLIHPPDDGILGDTIVTFEWHPSIDAGSGINHYVHEYDTDSLFGSPTIATPPDTFLAAVMPDSGTYYWRVHAVDGGDNHGANSEEWSFTVILTGVEESPERLRRAALSVEGNPTVGQAVFRLSLPEASHVDLKVYDAAGRLVDAPLKGKASAGNHRIAWEPKASGIYFYRLASKHLTKTGKVVVF
jgi:hypothetical protein